MNCFWIAEVATILSTTNSATCILARRGVVRYQQTEKIEQRGNNPVPTDFSDSFLPAIALKNTSDQCSLKKHCRGCLREVMGYLDLLAAKNPHRFVFASVKNITAHCNKFRLKGRPPYKDSMVKKSLAFARVHYLIGPLYELRVDGVPRKGFQVLAHDSMFVREGKLCRAPLYDDPFDFWKRFKSAMKNARAGTPPGTPQNTPPGTLPGTPENRQNQDAGYTRGYTSTRLQNPALVRDSGDARKIRDELSQAAATPNRGAGSVGLDEKPGETEEPADPSSNQAIADDDQKQGRGKPSPPTPLSSQTDRPKPADMGSQGQTVEQYFERVPNSELIYTLSNTRITPDKLVYKHWDDLTWHCVAAVNKWGPVQVDSKVLGDIMGTVMDLCAQEKTPDPPRSWYAVMKKLRVGEPLLCEPMKYVPRAFDPSLQSNTTVVPTEEIRAWNDFNANPLNQKLYPSLGDRRAAFDKIWKQ